MPLFQYRWGDPFKLRSGITSEWKIECDDLTQEDWEALACMAFPLLEPFGEVVGVPRGGLPLANAMATYSRSCSVTYFHPSHDWCLGSPLPLLIAEDVMTTGDSMERLRAQYPNRTVIGVCVFARGVPPTWVTPIFQMTQPRK